VSRPLDLQQYGGLYTSVADPNTHTLVAAPGADQRVRVWAVYFSLVDTVPMGTTALISMGGALFLGRLIYTDALTLYSEWPGGLALGENQPVTNSIYNLAAGRRVYEAVRYTVEEV
jgi:hypothetical protein